MSGIYVIRNIINNKIYIGSSVNITKRWNTHKRSLRNNTHHSIILQRAYNKYGIDNFSYEIIENINNKDILISREQIWLDFFKPEYNICITAGSNLGRKFSSYKKKVLTQEHKDNIAKSLIGRPSTNKGKPSPLIGTKRREESNIKQSLSIMGKPAYNRQGIVQYDINMNIINEFDSLSQAGLLLNIDRHKIVKIIKSNIIYNDFIFKYKKLN